MKSNTKKIGIVKLIICAALFAAALPFVSRAQTPSAAPVLRLETGMHTANITRIAVDRAGRLLVTASHDKTARVWDIATGKLLRVLRVPIGAGDEGKLYAVALTPDGGTVAVSGYTGFEWDKTISIYLFDASSGRMTRRIGNLPEVVYHLAFAPDGKRLAATLGSGGVRVFDISDGRQIGVDSDYGNLSLGADFDADGKRLVTSCFDGFIRLYAVTANELKFVAKRAVSGGKEPSSVKFAPDGKRIAVGFYDSTAVNVLSSADLSLEFAPDTTGVDNGDLGSVAWSATGDTLFAGGRYQSGENFTIRSWTNGGRGTFREMIAALDSIFDLQPLFDGAVIYGSGEPSWGIINRAGSRTRFVPSAVSVFSGSGKDFFISADGNTVRFNVAEYDKSQTQFSVTRRQLEPTATAMGNVQLEPPNTTGLNITDWKNNEEPKLNGGKLALEQYEKSRSLAVAPDNSRFLLGTDYRIRLFDRTGKELWNVPAPGTAWAVNISGDGRLAVAACGDGTIRWYRMTDGAELLAFFPHNDKKRWVMWTPSGYYDASPDAEDLIGWYVNNGKDAAADFFPLGLFRSEFYRPDVIDKILYATDEAKAVRFANEAAGRKNQQADAAKQLPPVVEILSPKDGAETSNQTVKIAYNLRTPSGEPVTNVKVLVNGRPVTTRQLEQESDNAREITVPIPPQDCEVSLIAENRFAPSVPATIKIKYKGATQANTDEFVIKPKLYVLAVGVSKYANTAYNLGFPAKDAKDFSAAMEKQKGGLYRDVVIKTLTDEQATRDSIVDALEWIRTQATSKDVAMIFFAGHGVNDALNRYYFCPHNFNLERQSSTGVGMNDIKSTVENIAGKVVLFMDSCHSGNVFGTAKSRDLADINGFVNELSSAENGAIIFAASTGRQVSLEDAVWNNGAFTKALVEGLNGKAEIPGKGKVTINSLDLYISERVKELTKGQQTPTTAKPNTVPDFPVALK